MGKHRLVFQHLLLCFTMLDVRSLLEVVGTDALEGRISNEADLMNTDWSEESQAEEMSVKMANILALSGRLFLDIIKSIHWSEGS